VAELDAIDSHHRAAGAPRRRPPGARHWTPITIAIGRGVGVRIVVEEFADLRPGEALERARPGPLREQLASADGGGDLFALPAGARIHPEGRNRS
jgi:hypothetical protein